VSHDGSATQAINLAKPQEIFDRLEAGTQVVAVDEAQFFSQEFVAVCQELADRGIRVIVAGLDTDFRGLPFGSMPALMAVAEEVDKLQAICVVCGAPAARTQRVINGHPARFEDPVILIGASEKYEARCRHCHQVPQEAAVDNS
jgi:thymidine kinase